MLVPPYPFDSKVLVSKHFVFKCLWPSRWSGAAHCRSGAWSSSTTSLEVEKLFLTSSDFGYTLRFGARAGKSLAWLARLFISLP